MKRKKGFTLIELIFVIVILGILASIAIPKFSQTQESAVIAKGKSDISAIRCAIINERQSRIIRGETGFITTLDHASKTSEGL